MALQGASQGLVTIGAMQKTPEFTAPVFYRDPAAALAQVQAIY